MPSTPLAHVKFAVLSTFRHRSSPPSDEELTAFAQAHPQDDLSLAELIEYLRVAIETARKKDADQQKAFTERKEQLAHAREMLRGVLRTYKGVRQAVVARRALWDAVQVAREAFRFAFAAERKKLIRSLGENLPTALAAEAVISLDQACGLDRKTGTIIWLSLGPSPSYDQFRLAAQEIEGRYEKLEIPWSQPVAQ